MDNRLAQEIAVTWELCGGRQLSEGGTEMILRLLTPYPAEHVRGALKRCIEELDRSITIGCIVSRIKEESHKPASFRDFPALPPKNDTVPPEKVAALCQAARELAGTGATTEEIEDRVAGILQEKQWDDVGI